MKYVLIFLLFVFNGKTYSQKLTGKTITIDVSYSAILCECAQWIETRLINPDKTKDLNIYLEPGNTKLINADTLWDGIHLPLQLRLTGQYYLAKGFPKNYKPAKGNPKPARVFRYTKISIISKK